MKQKVGIITFQRCVNFGAVLQTFALQKTINSLSKDTAEVIDYVNESTSKDNSNFVFLYKKNPAYIIYNLIKLPSWIKQKNKFDKFIKQNIKISKKIVECTSELNYNKYIVGSDQVWNHELTSFDKTYFLDFVKDNKKKYSYAASFGLNILDKKIILEYKKLLKDFRKISVREKEGKDLVKKILNRDDAEIVLDPTLLLDKNDWKKYCSKEYKDKRYILIYQLSYSKRLIEFAKKLAKETNLKIITINGNPRQPIKAKYIYGAGPEDFLGLFYNAEYIITNSFHGLVFSVNFNKSFYLDYLDGNTNSRLENFVKNYQLEGRLISANINEINKSKPNYDKINKQLELERKKSLKFLKSILEDK